MVTKKLDKMNLPKHYPLYSAALTTVCYLLILAFFGILGYDNLTILSGDLFVQYVPFIQHFLDSLKNGDNLWYSFSLYLGNSTASTFGYYCLSPLNLLYLIPGISVSAMTIVLICGKISLASAAFNYFLKKTLCLEKWYTILFSVAYSMSTYVIAMQTNIIWLDALYILPILMLFLFRFAKDGSALPLIATYSFLFLTNFYMGYIIGIYSALVFILLLVYRMTGPEMLSVKSALKKGFFYTLSVLLAAGICAIILLPCAVELISQRTADTDTFKLIGITLPDIINNLFLGEMQSLSVPVPLFYCGLPVLLLLPFYYTTSKISRREKILCSIIPAFYIVSSIFLPFYQFLHAFDAPNWYGHRYAICVVFTLLFMVCRMIPCLKQIHFRSVSVYAIGLILFYSVMIPFQTAFMSSGYFVNDQTGLLCNAFFFLLYLLILFFYQKNRYTRLLPLLCTLVLLVELLINGYLCMTHNSFDFYSEATVNHLENTESAMTRELKSIDNDFFRQRISNELCLNAASRFHYPGVNSFSTTDNVKLRQTLASLGISTSFMIIYDHGYTDLLKMLFSIKYEYDLNDPQNSLKINPFALPVAFTVPFATLGYQSVDNPFVNQQTLINTLSGRTDVFFYPVPVENIHWETKNMDFYPMDDSLLFQHITDIASNGIVSFYIDNPEGYPVYAYVCTDDAPSLNSSTPVAYGVPTGFANENRLSDGSVMLLPYVDGSSLLKLEFTNGEYFDYSVSDILFYYYDGSPLYEVSQSMKANAMQVEEWSDGYVRGTVTVSDGFPILFTSIPYDDGWYAIVDGKQPRPCGVTIESSFLSLPLEPGTHTVELIYEPPMLNKGRIISGVCVIIYLLLILIDHRKRTSKKKSAEKEAKE